MRTFSDSNGCNVFRNFQCGRFCLVPVRVSTRSNCGERRILIIKKGSYGPGCYCFESRFCVAALMGEKKKLFFVVTKVGDFPHQNNLKALTAQMRTKHDRNLLHQDQKPLENGCYNHFGLTVFFFCT